MTPFQQQLAVVLVFVLPVTVWAHIALARRCRRLLSKARIEWSEAKTMLVEVKKLNEEGRNRMRIAQERWQKAMDLEKR